MAIPTLTASSSLYQPKTNYLSQQLQSDSLGEVVPAQLAALGTIVTSKGKPCAKRVVCTPSGVCIVIWDCTSNLAFDQFALVRE